MVDHDGINYGSTMKSQMFRSMQSRNLSRKSLENSMTKCSSLPRLGKRYLKKAASSNFISTNTTFIWSPTVDTKPGSPKTTFKSLPALDQSFDQVDSELQTLSDSVDVLYQQEDQEIEFLDNFLDYDSISIVVTENEDTNITNPDVTKKIQDCTSIPPKMKNEKRKSRKNKIRERLRWLTSRSKLSMRNFGSGDNLKNMKEGLQKSKDRLSSALSPSRSRRGSYEWSVKLNSDGPNIRDSIIVVNDKEDVENREGKETKIEIKSFEVPVLKIGGTVRASKYTKNKQKNMKISKTKEEPVNDLEKLEKLVLRDSVRETLQKRKQLGPISEELDLAFNNLSYEAFDISESASRDARKYYENVEDNNASTNERTYENLQTDYENTLVTDRFYENLPNQERQKIFTHANEDYENYDFGENGIYQNILYEGKQKSISESEVNNLRNSVNEVNKLLKENKPTMVEKQPLKMFQSKLNIRLRLPCENSVDQLSTNENSLTQELEKRGSQIQHNSSTTRQVIGPSEDKIPTKVTPSTLKKPPNSLFRKWAFSKAEHPKIDLTKLNENPTLEIQGGRESSFTQKERDIVAKFLENVKSDLQNNK